jgi:hypothetical protein
MDGCGAWGDNVFVERLWRSVNDIEHRLTKALPCGSPPKELRLAIESASMLQIGGVQIGADSRPSPTHTFQGVTVVASLPAGSGFRRRSAAEAADARGDRLSQQDGTDDVGDADEK